MSQTLPKLPTGDRRPSIIAAVSVCMSFAALSVAGRFISRRMMHASFQVSDLLVVGGLAGAWVISLIVIVEANLGLGKHAFLVPFPNVRKILLTTYIGQIFYSVTFPMLKISVLLLYRSIFPGKTMRLATNLVGAFVILWGIALLFGTIFSCNPVHGFWDFFVKSKCVSTKWFFIGNTVPDILADLMLATLPIPPLWRLKMSVRRKIEVSAMFLLGGFVIVCSALRVYYVVKVNLFDATWTYAPIAMWSAIEIDLAVITACLPTLRPILRFLFSPIVRRIPGTLTGGTDNATHPSADASRGLASRGSVGGATGTGSRKSRTVDEAESAEELVEIPEYRRENWYVDS